MITEKDIEQYRTKAPFGWGSSFTTLFIWTDKEHTKWHAVYDVRGRQPRNLRQEEADVALICQLLNFLDAGAK